MCNGKLVSLVKTCRKREMMRKPLNQDFPSQYIVLLSNLICVEGEKGISKKSKLTSSSQSAFSSYLNQGNMISSPGESAGVHLCTLMYTCRLHTHLRWQPLSSGLLSQSRPYEDTNCSFCIHWTLLACAACQHLLALEKIGLFHWELHFLL